MATLCGDTGFYINEFLHGNMLRHNHKFFELAYILEGECVHNLDGVETHIKKGSYFIVDYEKYHSFRNAKGGHMKLLNCLFTSQFVDKSLINIKSFSEILKCRLLKYDYDLLMLEPTRTVFTDEDGSVLKTLLLMKTEFENKNTAYLEMIRFYLFEILIKTMRKITDTKREAHSDSIKSVTKHIENHFNENITLSESAQKLNYSSAHLSRKFKESTGMNFSEYLQRTRIKEACRLLCDTDKKIIEVAQLCGYCDVNTFNKLFKKYVGSTPSGFRKSIKRGGENE